MKKIVAFIMMVGITVSSFVYATQPAIVANDFTKEACNAADADQKVALGCDTDQTAPKVVEYLINAVISVLGIVAVVVIVVGGQRYIVSQGDASKIAAARGMVIYGVVGLVIALLAFAIVNFVLSSAFSQ